MINSVWNLAGEPLVVKVGKSPRKRRYSVSPQTVQFILDHPELTPRELAERFKVGKSTISRIRREGL